MNYSDNILYYDVVECLVAALAAKDRYTASHSKRVADTCYKLGSYLNLNYGDLELLHISAYLHDIGKIGLSDYIIHKKERLTNDEWKLIKEHPKIGYDILSKSQWLKPIAEIILYHHENYDGTGYPFKLKGNSINFISRIIAVCDSIDAMLTNRPYRKRLTYECCKQEIVRNKSRKYDPVIVDCLIRNWDSIIVNYYKIVPLKYKYIDT